MDQFRLHCWANGAGRQVRDERDSLCNCDWKVKYDVRTFMPSIGPDIRAYSLYSL
jgi:hypothetical protein